MNIVRYLIFGLLIFLFFSCRNYGYSMPYEPGIYADLETLSSEWEQWLDSKPNNYSYTYCLEYLHTGSNLIANIKIDNSDFLKKEIVEFNHKRRDDFTTNEKWEEYLNGIEIGDMSIDKIFSDCNDFVEESKKRILDEEYKDCYYVSCDIEYDKEYHFIKLCSLKSVIMKKDLDGNSGTIKISLSNFKVN